MTASRPVALAAVLVAVAALTWRLGGGASASFERPVLIVSGKDDHGLVASSEVDLLDAPEGEAVGAVPDGTLVQVLEETSTWLRVRTLEGERPLEGWLDDFHLRGTAHLVGDPPACPVPIHGEPGTGVLGEVPASTQVALADHHLVDGTAWVVVRPLAGEDLVLVDRAVVRELPGPRPDPDVPCATIRPDPDARPHRH